MIFKYYLNAHTPTQFHAQRPYKVLDIQCLYDVVVCWIDCGTDSETAHLQFTPLSTGNSPQPQQQYVKTLASGEITHWFVEEIPE